MAGFVHSHKVVARRAFLAVSSAWNGGESKGEVKSGELKCHSAITQCMTIVKARGTNILCPHSFIVCCKIKKNKIRKSKKPWKKKKKRKRNNWRLT
jgi:hypothetical protein